MKDENEKIGNASFNEEMQPKIYAKEAPILDDDDIGRKGWGMNTKSNEKENETKEYLNGSPIVNGFLNETKILFRRETVQSLKHDMNRTKTLD